MVDTLIAERDDYRGRVVEMLESAYNYLVALLSAIMEKWCAKASRLIAAIDELSSVVATYY